MDAQNRYPRDDDRLSVWLTGFKVGLNLLRDHMEPAGYTITTERLRRALTDRSGTSHDRSKARQVRRDVQDVCRNSGRRSIFDGTASYGTSLIDLPPYR